MKYVVMPQERNTVIPGIKSERQRTPVVY